MKFRVTLVALSFVLSLLVSADHLSDNCPGAWTGVSRASNSPQGLGVNIHVTDPQTGEIEMIANAGFRWIRMDFKWDATEKGRGRYDFSAYDRLLTSLQQHRMQALFILDYGNPLYDGGAPPRTAEARQAFTRWAVAAARHFARRDIIWETYNEPNIKLFWPPRPSVDEYIALALTVGRAFRTEVPSANLIGPATSGIDFPFLESCFKAGLLDYWSAVSVHPYRQSNPETAANDYCRLRQMIARYTQREIPIVSSEWGYSAVWRGMSEEKQSGMLVREMLTNIANGIPLSIWYDWRDDGSDPNEAEHHFGLVRNAYQTEASQPYNPKSAYLAARTLNILFDGYKFEKRLELGSDADYVLAFRKDERLSFAAWTTSAPHKIFLPVTRTPIQLSTHLGVQRVLTATDRGMPIDLSSVPVYIGP